MTPERYRQIVELSQAVWELAPEDRAGYLSTAASGDDTLRREVEAMLAADQQSADFLSDTPDDVAASAFLPRQPQVPVGTSLGEYRITSFLDFGGMGQVFLAQDVRLGRKVVIKLLPEELGCDAVWLHRFEEEACAVSALNHPNILTVYSFGQAGSMRFLATEYVDGCTLRKAMAGGALTVAKALDIAIQIASALVAAHNGGIVHRDIKPENIIVRPDGLVKVLDFGIATRAASGSDNLEANQSGFDTSAEILVGTPRYMSPEQARGLPLDGRTDLFSLGSVLYEMVSGHAAFNGSTAGEILSAVLTDEPAPLATFCPQVPAALASIVERALRKDINRRYQSAAELLTDLTELRKSLGSDSPAPPTSNGRRTQRGILAAAGTLSSS